MESMIFLFPGLLASDRFRLFHSALCKLISPARNPHKIKNYNLYFCQASIFQNSLKQCESWLVGHTYHHCTFENAQTESS